MEPLSATKSAREEGRKGSSFEVEIEDVAAHAAGPAGALLDSRGLHLHARVFNKCSSHWTSSSSHISYDNLPAVELRHSILYA